MFSFQLYYFPVVCYCPLSSPARPCSSSCGHNLLKCAPALACPWCQCARHQRCMNCRRPPRYTPRGLWIDASALSPASEFSRTTTLASPAQPRVIAWHSFSRPHLALSSRALVCTTASSRHHTRGYSWHNFRHGPSIETLPGVCLVRWDISRLVPQGTETHTGPQATPRDVCSLPLRSLDCWLSSAFIPGLQSHAHILILSQTHLQTLDLIRLSFNYSIGLLY